jgi:hypothetical protein
MSSSSSSRQQTQQNRRVSTPAPMTLRQAKWIGSTARDHNRSLSRAVLEQALRTLANCRVDASVSEDAEIAACVSAIHARLEGIEAADGHGGYTYEFRPDGTGVTVAWSRLGQVLLPRHRQVFDAMSRLRLLETRTRDGTYRIL